MLMFKETDGKISTTRLVAAVIVACVLAVMFMAAHAGQWEVTKTMTSELLLLVFGLYGINRAATTLKPQNG